MLRSKFRSIKVFRNLRIARSKNEWDSNINSPYTPRDEHPEPSEEDYVQEMFDKNYYHFHGKGLAADDHGDENPFEKYRVWQQLYTYDE